MLIIGRIDENMDKFRPLIIFSWLCLIPLEKWKENKIERKSTRKKNRVKFDIIFSFTYSKMFSLF